MKTPTPCSPLRLRMIEDMVARNLGPGSQRGNIHACKLFASFLGRSPETATPDDVRNFQRHLSRIMHDGHRCAALPDGAHAVVQPGWPSVATHCATRLGLICLARRLVRGAHAPGFTPMARGRARGCGTAFSRHNSTAGAHGCGSRVRRRALRSSTDVGVSCGTRRAPARAPRGSPRARYASARTMPSSASIVSDWRSRIDTMCGPTTAELCAA